MKPLAGLHKNWIKHLHSLFESQSQLGHQLIFGEPLAWILDNDLERLAWKVKPKLVLFFKGSILQT